MRDEVERAAAGQPYWLETPGDVWLVGDLGDMLDGDGHLSEAKMREALRRATKDRPTGPRDQTPPLGQVTVIWHTSRFGRLASGRPSIDEGATA